MLPRDVSSAPVTRPRGALCFIANGCYPYRWTLLLSIFSTKSVGASTHSFLVLQLVLLTSQIPFPLTTLYFPTLPLQFPFPLSQLQQPSLTPQLDSPDSGYHPANCPVIQVPSCHSWKKQEAGRRSALPAQGMARGCGLSWKTLALWHGYRSLQICCRSSSLAWLSFILTPVETVLDPT